ncbi:MAG: hypothetical protein GKR87_04720 [Kiritimatiellae bacterium]|nr:hypothetical protein [Kiritimatiellia bacterium]
MKKELESIRRDFIETAGLTTQSLSAGRVLGQIFAHIYFSREPQSLDDMTDILGVSKESASQSVRQLEQWGALKRVWIKGERKDYYEALDNFGHIIRKALLGTTIQKVESADRFLGKAEQRLKTTKNSPNDDVAFIKGRIKTLRKFRDRSKYIWEYSILRLLVKPR